MMVSHANEMSAPALMAFRDVLAEKLKALEVSQTAAEPAPALEAIGQLIGDARGERRVVYLISDFRARQWDQPGELKERLARLSGERTEIRLSSLWASRRPGPRGKSRSGFPRGSR